MYAFDPTNLSGPVYVNDQPATAVKPGNAVKFAVPAVINGKVYIGTQSTLAVYGMLTTPPAEPITLHGAQSSTADGVTAITLTKPAGAIAGDLLIAQIAAVDSTVAPITFTAVPPGWTIVSSRSRAAGGQLICDKITGTAEPVSYTWTTDIPVSAAGGIAAYGNVNTASPIDLMSSSYFSTPATTITAPSLRTQHEYERLIVLISTFTGENSSGWTFPPGMTNEFLAEDADTNVSALFLDQTLGLPDPTGARTALFQTAAPRAIAELAIRATGY